MALVTPILLLLILGIGDFARLYNGAINVEAAAREAADYGAFTASQWSTPANITATVNEMINRACTAASSLPDYVAAGSATALCSAPGSNPQFTYQLEDSTGAPISSPPGTCGDPTNDPPCLVHVTMRYTFHSFFSVGSYAATMSIVRSSRYAISDLQAPP